MSYQLIKNDNVAAWDVDDTLVSFNYIEGVEPITIKNGIYKEIAYPIQAEIDALRQAKVRNHFVIVWSQGGYEWAEAVVKTLGLEKHVDVIMTKCSWYHDDLPADAWMKRFYKNPWEKK